MNPFAQPVSGAPRPSGTRRKRPGLHVLGRRSATLGFVGVVVVLGGFMTASRLTLHQKATAIVARHRLTQEIDRIRLIALDEAILGATVDELGVALVTQRFDSASAGLDEAVAFLRGHLPPEADDELDDLEHHHESVRRSASALVGSRDGSRDDFDDARDRFRTATRLLMEQIERVSRRLQIGFDAAVSDLALTDRRVLVSTPLVLVLCMGAMALFGRQLRSFRRRIDHQALHDALTGLPNRQLLHDRAEQALTMARRTGVSTALLLIDLDRFKEINDTLGHHYGDLVLSEIGPRLISRLRDSDTVARLGGDEFAVLLTNLSGPDSALRVAEELARAIREPFRAGELTFDLEGSIGVAIAPDHATTGEELVQRADVAMYVAKTMHVGVAMYRPDTDRHSPEKLVLLGQLRHAIEADELMLYYQPKNAVPDGSVQGAEALVRWMHPERGLVPPDDFIPLAEHTSLIEPLTDWVLREATRQVRAWLDEGLRIPVAVNVSARSLGDVTFPNHVHTIVTEAGLDPSLIEIEVTETSIMREPDRARAVLTALAGLGFAIAIDDFGSGFTSLAYLRTLPVHSLKIDRMFVQHMHVDNNDAVIVRSVVELGHNLGLSVVAEGVEDEATCGDLGAMGCCLAQGYYWSRPVPAEAFRAWVVAHGAAALMLEA